MNSLFLKAVELMDRCIKGCDRIDQLLVTCDWISRVIVVDLYPEIEAETLAAARKMLFDEIENRKIKIYGIGEDDEKVNLLSGHGNHF